MNPHTNEKESWSKSFARVEAFLTWKAASVSQFETSEVVLVFPSVCIKARQEIISHFLKALKGSRQTVLPFYSMIPWLFSRVKKQTTGLNALIRQCIERKRKRQKDRKYVTFVWSTTEKTKCVCALCKYPTENLCALNWISAGEPVVDKVDWNHKTIYINCFSSRSGRMKIKLRFCSQ